MTNEYNISICNQHVTIMNKSKIEKKKSNK